jgi:hypothetical protein
MAEATFGGIEVGDLVTSSDRRPRDEGSRISNRLPENAQMAASFSLNEVLTTLRSQFPQEFPKGGGIRSHFPKLFQQRDLSALAGIQSAVGP